MTNQVIDLEVLVERVKEDPQYAVGTYVLLSAMEHMHKNGVTHFTSAQLKRLLGATEEEITPEDEQAMFELTEQFFEQREMIMAILQSSFAPKQ